MDIEYPLALLLFLCIPGVFAAKQKCLPRTGFSCVSFIGKNLEPGFFKKYSPDISAILFMACVIMALVNVRYSVFEEKVQLESRWIMLIQDLSGSMNRPGSRQGSTLGDITLEGVRAFIDMRDTDDLIGLIAFSGHAKLISPPTFDKKILIRKLDLLQRESDSAIFRELSAGGATNASYGAWLGLCTFFMLLPEENQPSYDELRNFRHSLLGKTLKTIAIPEKLKQVNFGHGMVIVMFTDGRIEANTTDKDIQKGLPNFVNIVKLLRKLGIRFYLIVTGKTINPDVKAAIETVRNNRSGGRIFYMPRRFDPETINAAFKTIHEMEKNKLLVKVFQKKKETRQIFASASMFFLLLYCIMNISPYFRRI